MLMLCVAASGCQEPKSTRIELATMDAAGASRQYFVEFERAAYRRTARGVVELVMKVEQPSELDPRQTITQLLYVRQFWSPRPGTTYAEATQINARLRYAILTPPTGVRYDGSAFVTCKLDKRTGELIGHIESGTLSPQYRMGDASEPFGPARLTGTFRATENPREVVNAIQTLGTLFSDKAGTPNQSITGDEQER